MSAPRWRILTYHLAVVRVSDSDLSQSREWAEAEVGSMLQRDDGGGVDLPWRTIAWKGIPARRTLGAEGEA